MFNKCLSKAVFCIKTNPKPMKTEILKRIRKSLLELESITKVELSEKLGISFPTISKFLSQMEEDGELISVGFDRSSGGRRAKRYAYNPEFKLGLAIFLERSETYYHVFNGFGEIKEAGKAQSVLTDDKLEIFTRMVEELIGKYPKISSLAIGVPGSVDHGRIIYIPGYEYLQGFHLKEYLEERFSIPVVIENDMNAAVLGYQERKTIEKNHSIIYLYFGQNGPGAGILVNGTVVRGKSNFSGEVSFVPQYDDCNFGQSLENAKWTEKMMDRKIDAIARLVASFVAIMNPYAIIFCDDEVDHLVKEQILKRSSAYIPAEHLPTIIMSNLKEDYLFGLQYLGFELMINELSR